MRLSPEILKKIRHETLDELIPTRPYDPSNAVEIEPVSREYWLVTDGQAIYEYGTKLGRAEVTVAVPPRLRMIPTFLMSRLIGMML